MMPTVLRCYCQRQTNSLLCRSIEFVCRQFYILHRKPFFLQMAGAAASILDMNDNDFEVNPMKVLKYSSFLNLLHFSITSLKTIVCQTFQYHYFFRSKQNIFLNY